MWYTRKGDSGSTKTLRQKPGVRISKSSCTTEALGALDELNSFLGLIKVRALQLPLEVGGKPLAELFHGVQENLFIAQAELAGADKRIVSEKVKALEAIIDAAEKKLPPVKSFFIGGGAPKGRWSAARELAAFLDIGRTIARRAERAVVAATEKREAMLSEGTLAYLNRLSSLLYALVRFLNHGAGVPEAAPSYR
ncbi:MAG: cobalamin adenosyltransferase PduO [Parcubacteria group bacterium Gr01-1014_17]|nr:MAG: cobalamin adenosyltransferase PduO [Parcubacteria group bacterium Gr01-1014_17]